MDVRHVDDCPDLVFAPDKTASSLKTVFNEQRQLPHGLVYVIVMARRGKPREANLALGAP